MIPALAIMIGAYIITRMVELMVREMEARDTHNSIIVCATVTIIVVVIALIVVWTNEREAARAFDETRRILDTYR